MNAPINREAGDKAKGPRLQKLRCASLILDAIEEVGSPYIFAAIEHKDDVFIKDALRDKDYLEQDKNYSDSSSFTYNSEEVKNTIVGYCDIWVEYGVKSKDVYLGFYSTNNYGKENRTALIEELGIELPDKPILELLQQKKFDYPNLLDTVIALTLEEYKRQYSKRNQSGNLQSLNAFCKEDWIKFFNCIEWKFGENDERDMFETLIEKIKNCRFYNHFCIGREEYILRSILDLIDERQCAKDLMGKFVYVAQVQLIFKEVSSQESPHISNDPIYKIWDSLPPPEDRRNILDKLNAVNSNISRNTLQYYARKTAAGKVIYENRGGDRTFLSLRYRIYDKCHDELKEYMQTHHSDGMLSETDITALYKHLNNVAKELVDNMSTDFYYSLKSEPVIEGVILELFDSCYLAFENNG